jgi:hypothetical protein
MGGGKGGFGGAAGGGLWAEAQKTGQTLAQALVAVAALAMLAATVAAAAGLIPWPELSLRWGGAYIPQAGMYGQVALTVLLALMCVFLPANARMARLERSHRSFQISLEDVRRAYEIAHAADRRNLFGLSSEFDAMRARMDHLRKHPDLADLEPELLQLAAQMSHESRDLARIYSEERVTRAKTFLAHRQQEVERMADKITLARSVCDEMRRWLTDVEAEERKNHGHLKRLEADLREILPGLGYDVDEMRDANVVALAVPQKGVGPN